MEIIKTLKILKDYQYLIFIFNLIGTIEDINEIIIPKIESNDKFLFLNIRFPLSKIED